MTKVPSKDTTLKALRAVSINQTDVPQKDVFQGHTKTVLVGLLTLTFAVAGAWAFHCCRQRKVSTRSPVKRMCFYQEKANAFDERSQLKRLKAMYPDGFPNKSLEKALIEAQLTQDRVDMICFACKSLEASVLARTDVPGELSKEDISGIAMFTYDFGQDEMEYNPYRLINKPLGERNIAGLQRISSLLYILIRSLRKLPRVSGKTLYRAIDRNVNIDEDHYHEGNMITWMAFSSTSLDMNTSKDFLAQNLDKTAGTLFVIENGWGYDIQPYSLFPDEAEILLEPERQFMVKSVVPSTDLTVINLQMLDTPLVTFNSDQDNITVSLD